MSRLELWREYSIGKQTIAELSEQYSVSASTIKRYLRGITEVFECKNFPSGGVILMDVTYWGRNWGVMVFMDSFTRRILWRKYLKNEKLIDYMEGIDFVLSKNYKIEGLVCDGFSGILSLFSAYQIQMCQFHQLQIIRRYLTQKPKLEASKELHLLVKKMTQLSKNEFVLEFTEWENRWELFLKERTKDENTGKSHYTHKKLRSAVKSLKRHLPYLFVFEQVCGMPNTNNALEGTFTALKNKIRCHNGMSKKNRIRFIDGFFKA